MPPPTRPLKDLFLAALDVAPADRPAWLDRECAADTGLREQLRRMLAAHDAPQSLLDRPGDPPAAPPGADPWATSDLPAAEPDPGTVIGPYKLVEQLGEGGFGVVYLAEQTHPVRRRVALKVLKPGMDSRNVVARFEAERQALAIMDHPHIAKVFDAGTTPAGQPFFVMELVKGVPITDFCDQHHLTPRDRLGLFVQVCGAVQHAHQKGVIHRDLKPSNVLVSRHDTTPVVKVIDFGVAKALGQGLTDKTLLTGLAQMVGTPLYMSPEQAGMSDLDVDTRSDVYSLGVLLYELLTGTTPFDKARFRKAAYDEMRRIIREEEPPRPSTRLSESKDVLPSVAAQRQTEPARLTKLVRGELDWIVMKALEKDRSRRYETANGFALDVQRYLAGEPVLAVPPSAGYRLRKFVRKNRGPLSVAAAFLLLLTVSAIASTWQAIRATVAERAADGRKREADDAKRQAEERGDTLATLNATLRRAKYIAEMNLAQHAWEANNLVRTHQLLDQYRPGPGETDLRGFEWYYLNRLLHAERWTAKANAGFVSSVAFTPDGKWLYSFGKDQLPQKAGPYIEDLPGEVKLWNTATGRQLPFDLSLPTSKMRRIALSRDGNQLAASCWDQGFRVWDLATGRSIALGVPAGEGAYDLGFSPDGKRLVTMSIVGYGEGEPCIVRVWDLASRKPAVTLDQQKYLFRVPSFSPDGKYLAVPSYHSGHVRVIDSATGREAFTCKSGDILLDQVVFSPDGKSLAGCGQQGVRIWDVSTRERRASLPSAAHLGTVLAYSPDGSRLAVGSYEGLMELWDVGSGQMLRALKGHGGEIRGIAFSPDGALIASAGADGTLRVWDNSGQRDSLPIFQQPERLGNTVFSPDGKTLVVETIGDRRWHLVDALSGQRRGGPIEIDQQTDNCIGWSSDGGRLVFTGPDKTIAIRDAASGARVRSIRVDAGAGCVSDISPDGQWLACAAPAGTIKVLDAQTGDERRSILGSTDEVHRLALSPDGSRLAGADNAGWIRVWETTSGRETMSVQVNGVYAVGLRFSPDGKRLAIVGNNPILRSGEARILDAEDGREVAQLRGHTLLVSDVAFHPDGQRVATCSGDRTIRIWDVPTGQEIFTLKGHTDDVNSIRFLRGGRQLRSASRDGTIRVWDAGPLPD